MTSDKSYQARLLKNWEATYKKGQLTFWILLAIRKQSLYVHEIKQFITQSTNGTISCEDQSLYRALRKYYDLEMVDFELRDGHKGPERKYYHLTKLGQKVLNQFIERNIMLFYNTEIVRLIQS